MEIVDPIKSKKDILRIIKYLREKNILYSTIFQFGIYSGLRVSDILALNVSDVLNKKYVEIREKKTHKYKKIPINNRLEEVINEYLSYRQEMYCQNRALFVSKKGCRLGRSQVYRFINEACKELDIEGDFGTHTMRKTFGYHFYQDTKDIVLLQKIFNHSSPSVTLHYIGITQEIIDDVYMGLNYERSKNVNLIPHKKKTQEKVIEFLQNYILNGGEKHKEFAQLALAEMAL